MYNQPIYEYLMVIRKLSVFYSRLILSKKERSMKHLKRVYKKTVSIVNETAIDIYEKLAGDGKGFLLESYDKNNGRYTFLGSDPEEIISSGEHALIIQRNDGTKEIREGNPILLLKEYYDTFQVKKDEGELAFNGGLVGCFGYDFIRYSEELPDNNEDEIGIGTIQLMLATKFIVIDHVAETLSAVVVGEDSKKGREESMEEIQKLILMSRERNQSSHRAFQLDGKIIKKSDTLEEYSNKVEKIKEYIREGDIFQTVISQRWTIETEQTGFELYRNLRELNPSPYLYYFQFGDFEVIGSSPEMLVKQTDQKVYTCPIAGTRKRGRDKEEDIKLQKELLGDEKEKAEHVMLVDLARNDMGRISEFGTVKVSKFMEVENYSHVMHIASLVEGKKKGEYHPLDLLSSFLPAGTLSGAPKIRAMEIIDELEMSRRGLYGGATGYLDFDGDLDFCITIRTMIKKQNKVYLQAGAGIVADSNAKSEYEECCNKVMALSKTLIREEEL
jgi:anthranilate synthase component 1